MTQSNQVLYEILLDSVEVVPGISEFEKYVRFDSGINKKQSIMVGMNFRTMEERDRNT